MSDLTKNGAGVPALPDDYVSKLLSGIAESRASTQLAGGGKQFLRMMKTGEWVFGPGNEEVQEGSHWAINIMSLVHGWCCWVEVAGGKRELQGEVMCAMVEPKPARPMPINGTPYGEQRGFALKCMDGADIGKEVIYKTNSMGGTAAVDELLEKIHARLASNPRYPCPVVTLSDDRYPNKKYGGYTYTPIFTVTGWASMSGELEGSATALLPSEADAAPVEKAPPPSRQRKAPLTAAAAPAPTARVAAGGATAAPTPTLGQRRRPSGRDLT